jgi:hypothetical protein
MSNPTTEEVLTYEHEFILYAVIRAVVSKTSVSLGDIERELASIEKIVDATSRSASPARRAGFTAAQAVLAKMKDPHYLP